MTVAEWKQLVMDLVNQGDPHDIPGCPADDSCECPLAARLNEALSDKPVQEEAAADTRDRYHDALALIHQFSPHERATPTECKRNCAVCVAKKALKLVREDPKPKGDPPNDLDALDVDVLTQAEFDALPIFNVGTPTPTTNIGKRWKRRLGTTDKPDWCTAEYVTHLVPGQVGIKWRRVEIR